MKFCNHHFNSKFNYFMELFFINPVTNHLAGGNHCVGKHVVV